jgi:hypothetical protein
MTFGIRAINPTPAANIPHILGFAVPRSISADKLFSLRNGPDATHEVLGVDKDGVLVVKGPTTLASLNLVGTGSTGTIGLSVGGVQILDQFRTLANVFASTTIINSGVFALARIPTMDAAHIPSLDASKITTGTFANARISQASVTQHQTALQINSTQITGTIFSGMTDVTFNGSVTANGGVTLNSGPLRVTGTSYIAADGTSYFGNIEAIGLAINGNVTGTPKFIGPVREGYVSVTVNGPTPASLRTCDLSKGSFFMFNFLSASNAGGFQDIVFTNVPTTDSAYNVRVIVFNGGSVLSKRFGSTSQNIDWFQGGPNHQIGGTPPGWTPATNSTEMFEFTFYPGLPNGRNILGRRLGAH